MQSIRSADSVGRQVGRYHVYGEIASGGMATVHLGRLLGAVGFSKTVAIKRLHEHLANEPEFVAMLIDEAKLVSSINHPNVVSTLDVVSESDELLIVMDYIEGATLARLLSDLRDDPSLSAPDPAVFSRIVVDALSGLHAAHVAKTHRGEPLNIVHRDVSPQNIMVGVDGIARVLDFGIAKAEHRRHSTRPGQIKGKFAYMSPEQVRGGAVDARTDVFAAGVVLWECLTRRRLFADKEIDRGVARVLTMSVAAPSTHAKDVSPDLDAVVLRALSRNPSDRHASAAEFARALSSALEPASASDVGSWVTAMAKRSLDGRAKLLRELETSTIVDSGLSTAPSLHGAPSRKSTPVKASERPRADVVTVPIGPSAAMKSRRAAFLACATFALGVGATSLVYELGSRSASASVQNRSSTATRKAPAAGDGLKTPSDGTPEESHTVAPPTSRETEPANDATRASTAASRTEPGVDAQSEFAGAVPTVRDETPRQPSSKTRHPPTPTARPKPSGLDALEPVPGAKPTPTATSAAPSAPSCNPPYRIDELGIRRVRRECL